MGLFQPGWPVSRARVCRYASWVSTCNAIASYLISLYCSLAVLTDDAWLFWMTWRSAEYHDYPDTYQSGGSPPWAAVGAGRVARRGTWPGWPASCSRRRLPGLPGGAAALASPPEAPAEIRLDDGGSAAAAAAPSRRCRPNPFHGSTPAAGLAGNPARCRRPARRLPTFSPPVSSPLAPSTPYYFLGEPVPSTAPRIRPGGWLNRIVRDPFACPAMASCKPSWRRSPTTGAAATPVGPGRAISTSSTGPRRRPGQRTAPVQPPRPRPSTCRRCGGTPHPSRSGSMAATDLVRQRRHHPKTQAVIDRLAYFYQHELQHPPGRPRTGRPPRRTPTRARAARWRASSGPRPRRRSSLCAAPPRAST